MALARVDNFKYIYTNIKEYKGVKMNYTICLECGKKFHQERDLEICDKCINLFDTDKLWQDHDDNKIDALDFNERKSIRERYRKTKGI